MQLTGYSCRSIDRYRRDAEYMPKARHRQMRMLGPYMSDMTYSNLLPSALEKLNETAQQNIMRHM